MKQRQISNYISELIAKDAALNSELKKIKKIVSPKITDEKRIFILFKKLIIKYPTNHEVLKCFLDFLQSLNDEGLIKELV